MHHVRGVCVGRASSADDSKGSASTKQPTKTAQNKTHFRTIAPKVAPKIVSSCTPSFAQSMTDITASGTKPFVMQPQNYALMKVAGQDGTFSLVALPQVTPSVSGPVIQTTGIPLQENLKLPIPRYQSSREKKLLNKKSIVQNKSKVEKSSVKTTQVKETKIKEEYKEETPTLKCNFQATTEEASSESGIFYEAQVVNIPNPVSLCVDKIVPSTSIATSPIKLKNEIKMSAGAKVKDSLANFESAKVINSPNHAAILSPMVFGSPVHLLPSAPKGKVPIMPYSKIKKSIISSCKPLASFSTSSQSSVVKIEVQTSSSEGQTTPSSAAAADKISIPDNPNSSIPRPDVAPSKQTFVSSKRRGKKRKSSCEISRYQTKMRLVGNRFILCKERVKSQSIEANDKSTSPVKKYRNIMPKPFVDIQGLVSSPVLPTYTRESAFRNRMITIKTHRCRQSDTIPESQHDCKIQSLPPKSLYKCPICDHSFLFKHHLQDHLNSHSNKRPYHCRLCRKAYVHSGSLSTHMKLHHSDSRLKKMMCCEFCAKVFGHIRVYFGHLKEVHRVIISTELSAKQVTKKNLIHSSEMVTLDRDKNGNTVDASHRQRGDVRIQIICGRCDFIAPTFSDMKVHLFFVHGDDFQEIIQDGSLENQKGAQEEVVKNAPHQWKVLSGKQNVLKYRKFDDELSGSGISDSTDSKLKDTASMVLVGQEPARLEKNLPCSSIRFCCGNVFNCLLCKEVFEAQIELFEHWKKKHNCDDPLVLWSIFSSFAKNN